MKAQSGVKIIIFLILIYAIYYAYTYYRSDKETTQKTLINKETQFIETYKTVINRGEIFKPNVNFTLSWNMKILNMPSNFVWNSSVRKNKPIVINGGCPDIYYNPFNNQLLIMFQFLDTHSMTMPKTITIKDVPVQSWVNYVLVVKGRQINFYMNGQLKHSHLLENVPMKQQGGLKFGEINNNFLGFVNNFVYYNYPLKMNEVQSISS